MAFICSRSRTPPAALTPIASPTTRRISMTSAIVAPPGPKPVEVLTKSAPAALVSVRRGDLFFFGQQRRFDDHLADDAVLAAWRGDGLDILLDQPQVARLERADIDHHVDLGGAVENRAPRFVLLHIRRRRAQRKTNDGTDAHAAAAQQPCAERDPCWVDAHRREVKLRRLATQFLNLGGGRVGFEQRVVDQAGHLAGAATGGVQTEPARAGSEDTAHLRGAAIRGKAMTGAARRRHGAGGGQLLENDVDDAANVRQRDVDDFTASVRDS